MRQAAVIGGGVSGALLVMQCLKQVRGPVRLLWFDKDDLFCRGLAYSTAQEAHLLNVRASNMSAFPDEPGDFVAWLHAGAYPYGASDFVPRKLYGLYISQRFGALRAQNPQVEVLQIAEEVVALSRQPQGFSLTAGRIYEAGSVVLALGNFLPGHPRSGDMAFAASPLYFRNAFSPQVLDEPVLSETHLTIVGAGLTMIDTVLAIKAKGFRGRIAVISPHGYLPQPHAGSAQPVPDYIDPGKHYSLFELFGLVKRRLRQAAGQGQDAHSVIDALRPHVQRLWMGFSTDDRLRFLRHLRHKWGVARHRAPLQSAQLIGGWIADGTISVIKGRIQHIAIDRGDPGGFRIRFRNGDGRELAFLTGVIINCTGPEPDVHKVDHPLVKQLIQSGLIRAHALCYGLEASEAGQLGPGLWTLGPPLKGVLWESTAVPEIRLQAAVLAAKLF